LGKRDASTCRNKVLRTRKELKGKEKKGKKRMRGIYSKKETNRKDMDVNKTKLSAEWRSR
jgi:hypothetical protein